MLITKELIEKVAKIARLKLNEKEKSNFITDFENILGLFSKLKNIDTKDIEISVQPVKSNNIFREDKVEKSLNEKEVFQNTELKEKGFFKGPRIL